MLWVRGFVVLLAVTQAAFMAFMGLHGLIMGDYYTPRSGPFKGKLGPWSAVVESVGIDPRSLVMKLIFLAYGLIWFLIIARFVRGHRWSRAGMIGAAVGSLWWLGPGTPLSIAQILVLILLPSNLPAEQPT